MGNWVGWIDQRDRCKVSGMHLGFYGYPFIWCNRRLGDQNTWVRLDRGVATIEWILRFPTSRIHHLDAFHSDHKTLLLCSDFEFKRFYRKGKPFQFEAMWLKDSSCELVIKDSWGEQAVSESVWGFHRKIVACQLKLKEWDKKCFGHVRNSLQKKLKELQEAEEGGNYRTNPRRIYMLREEIQRLKNKEECYRRNFIVGLEDSDGVWREDEGRMGCIIENYFRDIYTTSNPSGFDEILSGIHPTITEEDARLLG
ncbi:uncharacterized protein LOC142625022 [Castanea sativa]|uniref:uncharacterized protein LOC142625022 n=1 Tax=Castanea sativa TaxID=21020 RepID=UPI003F64B941